MTTEPVSAAQLGRFRQMPALAREVWQGGVVRLPAWIEQEDADPYRPFGVIWVSLSTGRMTILAEPEPDSHGPDLVLRALLKFARQEKKELGGRARRLLVGDQSMREYLEQALGQETASVEVVPRLDAVDDVLREYRSLVERDVVPGALEGEGVTLDVMRSFADAAACYYAAAPWQHLCDEDLIEIAAPAAPPGCGFALVLGNAGHTFGLAFYSSRDQHDAMKDASGPEAIDEMPGVKRSIIFDGADGIPFSDHDLWLDHDLPLAAPRAYPFAAYYHAPGHATRPGRADLEFFEAILQALAETTEEEMDGGRWSKTVAAGGGRRVQVRLSLPGLLDPGRPGAHVGPDSHRRSSERMHAEIGRFFETHEFESPDEANAALAEHFSGRPIDDLPSTASTPLERAQELAYQAYDWVGRKRVVMARQALALSPECAEAYVILAESAPTPERALPLYEQAVAAGRHAIGDAFDGLAGRFWGRVDTRPYMRARVELAQTLEQLGRHAEAMAHFQDLLRLNPGDNQGVRFLLLPRLLQFGRDDEARAVLDQYPEDGSAGIMYAEALLAFRTMGDSEQARGALDAALLANPHVPEFLLDPVDDFVEHYALGSEEEGIACAAEMGEAWDATPGALDWLRERMLAQRAARRAAARRRAKKQRGATRRRK